MSDEVPERVERRSRVINATPAQIFDLLADPSKHSTFDGSGTVQQSTDSSPERLSEGAKFGMNMRWGVPYRMTNEVVEFDEPSLIAWRHFAGHVWRYRLREVDSEVDDGTEVTEEFDWRPSRAAFLLKATKTPEKNAKSIEATLDRLADIFPDDA